MWPVKKRQEVRGSLSFSIFFFLMRNARTRDQKQQMFRQPFHLRVWRGQKGRLAPQVEPQGSFVSFDLSSYRLSPSCL